MAIKLCTQYDNLTSKERIILVGEVVHCIQSDNLLFDMAKEILSKGHELKVLDGVIFLPDENKEA